MEPIGLLKWSKEYESGINEVDEQHKNIMNVLNKIYYAVEDQTIEEQVPTLIKELDFYVGVHFSLEEYYAEKYRFPQIEQLKESHNFFRRTYQEMRSHYVYYKSNKESYSQPYIENYSRQYAQHLHSVMDQWLIFHLNTLDKALFDFLRDKISH